MIFYQIIIFYFQSISNYVTDGCERLVQEPNFFGVPSIDAICETVLVVGVNVRYYILLRKRKEVVKIIDECEALWNNCSEEDHVTILIYERKMRTLFKCLLGSCIFINFLYPVTAYYARLPPLEPNGTEQRVLPYKWYIEDPSNLWPGYAPTFILQMVVIYNAGAIATTVDSTAPLLMMMGCGFFKTLQDRLIQTAELDDTKEGEEQADEELVSCSKFHQDILNYCLNIEGLTRILFLVQVACSGYNASLIAIKLSGSDQDKLKYVPLFLLNMGQLFICQWAPDYVIDESGAVSAAAYFASFTWMRRKIGKLLVLIIARAQKPVQMTAGGVVDLSLESFGSMLTSAFSFFTMLRNFNA